MAQLNVDIPDGLKVRLKTRAAAQSVTVQSVLVTALNEYLSRVEHDGRPRPKREATRG